MWGSTQWDRKCQDYQGTLTLAQDVGSTYMEIYQDDLLIPELGRMTTPEIPRHDGMTKPDSCLTSMVAELRTVI
jgi:hypothetical protein